MEIYWQGHLTFTSFFTYFLNMVSKLYRISHPDEFLEKVILKICSNFKGEHPNRSAISIKLQSNFIEITLRHGCSPVNLLHISRTTLSRNTSVLRINLLSISVITFSWHQKVVFAALYFHIIVAEHFEKEQPRIW